MNLSKAPGFSLAKRPSYASPYPTTQNLLHDHLVINGEVTACAIPLVREGRAPLSWGLAPMPSAMVIMLKPDDPSYAKPSPEDR